MLDEKEYLLTDKVAYANVENSLEEILTGSEIIKDMFARGEIGIVGGVYNVENGQVDFFKNLTKKDKRSIKHTLAVTNENNL